MGAYMKRIATKMPTKITSLVIILTFLVSFEPLSATAINNTTLRPMSTVEGPHAVVGGILDDLTGVPHNHAEALEALRQLYDQRMVVLACGAHDISNEGTYDDAACTASLREAGVPQDLVLAIAQSEYLRTQAQHCVIDMGALWALIAHHYPTASPTERIALLNEMLPKAKVRVQGTDGWRGAVQQNPSPHPQEINPRVVCPENFRRYAFAYACWLRDTLLQTGRKAEGEPVRIVVGYDPRDPDRMITNAIIEGIRRAGVDVIEVGVSATPTTPLYMLYEEADGALEITASHNRGRIPGDQFLGQNGIKLFLGFNGLKLFPPDDEELTAYYYYYHNRGLEGVASLGALEDHSAALRPVLEEVFLDPVNTWALAPDGTPLAQPPLDENTIIVFDGGRGAYSSRVQETRGMAASVLERVTGARVIAPRETMDHGDGAVNYKSGAGFIEGFHRRDRITRADVNQGGELYGFEAIDTMFRIVDEGSLRRAIQRGEKRVMAVLLDADGDRYIRLDYDPFEDCLLISSGDEASYHQARFLTDEEKTPFRDADGHPAFDGARFIFTVESDLGGVISAIRDLQLDGDVRGVGDKWVLLQATLEYLAAYIDVTEELLGDDAHQFRDRLDDLQEDLRSLGRQPREGQDIHISSRRIMEVAGKVEQLRRDAGVSEEAIDEAMCQPGKVHYAIGSEETGHAITFMVIRTKSGKKKIVYFGNGLKSALNDVIATSMLYPRTPDTNASRLYYHFLANPFSRGHKENYYTYYTNKDLFREGSAVFYGLRDMWIDYIRQAFVEEGRSVEVTVAVKAEEPDMLYLEIWEHGNIIASAFCRNSGTEPKTTVYVRGRRDDGIIMGRIVNAGRDYIALHMKERNNPQVQVQCAMMTLLEDVGPLSRDEIKRRLVQQNPAFAQVNIDEVIDQSWSREALLSIAAAPTIGPEVFGEVFSIGPRGEFFLREYVHAPLPAADIVRQNIPMIAGDLQAAGIDPEEVSVNVVEFDEPASRSDFNSTTKTLTVYINPALEMPIENQVSIALYNCIIATPARLAAAERHQAAATALLRGEIPQPDWYGFTVKDAALIGLGARNVMAIRDGQLPASARGFFAPYVGTDASFGAAAPLGHLVVRASNVVNYAEQNGTLKGDLSGLVNLEKMTEAMIRGIVNERRPELSEAEREDLVRQACQRRNTVNIWTAGSGTREAELSHGAKGNKANITLATGFSFISAIVQESAMLTAFPEQISLLQFIDEWKPGQTPATGINIQSACDRISMVTNENFVSDLEESVRQYGLAMVGNAVDLDTLTDDIASSFGWIIADAEGRVVDFAEKPPSAEALRQRVPPGCRAALSWHLFGIDQEVMWEMAQREGFGDLYEKHMDFSMDLQEAVLTKPAEGEVLAEGQAPQAWMDKRTSNERLQYTEAEWARVWCIAQRLFPNGLGFVDAGADAVFFDTGSLPTLFRLMKAFGEDTDFGRLLRTKYNMQLTENGALVINSSLGPDVVLEPGAVVVNASVRRGRIAGVVTDVVAGELDVDATSWVSDSYRPGERIIAHDNQLVVDWYLEGQEHPIRTVTDTRKSIYKAHMQDEPLSGLPYSLAELVELYDLQRGLAVREQIRSHLPSAQPAIVGLRGEFGDAVIPENLVACRANDAQRHALMAQGVVADNWDEVYLEEGFDTSALRNVHITGPVYFKKGAVISDATIGFSVVEQGATIRGGSDVQHAYVGRDAEITQSTVRGAGGICAKDNAPNIVTIAHDAVIEAHSVVLTGNFRVSWREYEGVLSYGNSQGVPTTIGAGAHLSGTYVNNAEIGADVLANGGYAELCHILPGSWLYPGSRVVLATVGGKIGADMILNAEGQLFLFPAQPDGAPSLNFSAAISLGTSRAPDGSVVTYPCPFVALPGATGPVTANWYGGGKADDPAAMLKGCMLYGPGVVLGPGAKIFVEKGHPDAEESLSAILERDDMTILGPLVEVVENGEAIGRVPAFTVVRGMSRTQWDVGAILDTHPERVVATIVTMQNHMRQTGQEWTLAHDALVENWIQEALTTTMRMFEQETSQPKRAALQAGIDRYLRNLRGGRWKMQEGVFTDPALRAQQDTGRGLEEVMFGAAMEMPGVSTPVETGALSPAARQARAELSSIANIELNAHTKAQLISRGVRIAEGTRIFVEEGYDLNNISSSAALSGEVRLAGGVEVHGTLSHSSVVGGVIDEGAVLVNSVVDNRARVSQPIHVVSGILHSSYVCNVSVPANAHIARSSVVADADDTCLLESGEKTIAISNSTLRNVDVYQGVSLINVNARTDRETIVSFAFPRREITHDINAAGMPQGMRLAWELAVTKTFGDAGENIRVERTVFGEGTQAYGADEIVNASFGEGTTIKGARSIRNVVAAARADIRLNVHLENGYLGEAAVAGGSMNGFLLPAHAANGHSDSQARDYYILDYVPVCFPAGSAMAADFTRAYRDTENGVIFGVCRLARSQSNVGAGTAISRFVGIETFTQINSRASRNGNYILAGFGAFIHDMGQAPAHYAPACSYDRRRLGYELLDPQRLVFKTLNSGVDYGRIIEGALRLELFYLRQTEEHAENALQRQQYRDARRLYEAVVRERVFQTRMSDEGAALFVSPWQKIGVQGRETWMNTRLMEALLTVNTPQAITVRQAWENA